MTVQNYRTQWFSNLGDARRDVLAGIVVALALIPEAIGFSIISGVDPRVGLYASVAIAIVISFLGGRPAMISAATAAVAVVVTPLVREHVEEFGSARVVGITQTQKSEINEIVDRAIREGKNPLAVTDDLAKHYDEEIIPNRAEVIARTEMGRASNWGTYQGHRLSGLVEAREWIASIDNRVRRAHGNGGLNGQVVKMDETFEIPAGNPNAGATAKFPHGFGIAKQDIQCRCTTGAVLPERHAGPSHYKTEDGYVLEASRETIWKVYDSDLRQSERRFGAVVRETMRKVRNTTLRRAGRVLGVDVSDRIRTDDEEVA